MKHFSTFFDVKSVRESSLKKLLIMENMLLQLLSINKKFLDDLN